MTAFIRQEALEKAREIHLKADEEFAIEKSQLVRQETTAVDAQYEKKFKQAGMSQQITKSTLANKMRLRLLSSRQELLNDLYDQAAKKLPERSAGDQGKYQGMLKNLLLEGLYALNEPKASVRCRAKDDDVMRKAIEDARAEYKENMKGREVEVVIDDKEKLPEGSYVFYPPAVLLICPPMLTIQSHKTAPAASPSSTALEKSKSTTPSRSVCACSRRTPCPP